MFLDALYIVIPAYNEEANIESVARADPLLAATEKYKNHKGTGGKQHGK